MLTETVFWILRFDTNWVMHFAGKRTNSKMPASQAATKQTGAHVQRGIEARQQLTLDSLKMRS